MFFGKLFKKDYRHYQNQGSKHLAAERYADARLDFLEALKLCPADAEKDQTDIRKGLERAANCLGELNLSEAEHLVRAGDLAKARAHFTLAAELAVEKGIKDRALQGLNKLQQLPAEGALQAAPKQAAHGGSSCGTCSSSGSYHAAAVEDGSFEEAFSDEERFTLMVQPLPGALSRRYAAMGPEFARAYLMIQDGKDNEAFPILKEMLVSGDNDIVIYELALIIYRAGRVHECESLLNRALQANVENAMCYLALVQLMAGEGRYAEAIATLNRMLELGILPDQAQLMLGELNEAAGDEGAALEAWSRALEMPSVARPAAEKLVPILSNQGRHEEAKYLAKRFLKGCC